MSRVEQAVKYRCDGCGNEQSNPVGWVSLSFLPVMGVAYQQMTGVHRSEDYCADCLRIMRQSVRGLK